jgi:hypothetical protein
MSKPMWATREWEKKKDIPDVTTPPLANMPV